MPKQTADIAFYVLLAAWLAALFAPGALVAAGVFGHVDAQTPISGHVVQLWLGGWFVQFALFFAITRIMDPGFVAWFGASLIPWANDWTLPVSPWLGVFWLVLALAIALVAARRKHEATFFKEQGVAASGVVLTVDKPVMNVIVNGAYIRRKVSVRVEGLRGMAPFETKIAGLFMLGNIPAPGDTISLLVDPHNPHHLVAAQGDV